MIVLYILLAIIALIVLAFSFRLTLQLDYHDIMELEVRYPVSYTHLTLPTICSV